MKVLIVIDSLGLGGAENLLTVLAGSAASAGLELHVASLTPSSLGRVALQKQMHDAGLTTSFLDVPRLLHPAAVTAVGREIRRVGADVVHAHLGYSAILAPLAARALRRGSVSSLHHVPESLSPREALKERMAVEISGRLGALVLVSDASRRGFAERYRERDSWLTVYNAVDLQRFHPGRGALPADLGIPDGAPVVTVVAALREPKGHTHALQAWRSVVTRHPDAHLLLVGEGPHRAVLEDVRAAHPEMHDRVVLAGLRHDIPEILRASTVVLLPSLTEALPTVLIEAAGCARPVVATTVGGTPEVVADGTTGLLVPPADARALADALLLLLGDAALRDRMGAAGRRLAEERFDADVWARRLRAVYDEVGRHR